MDYTNKIILGNCEDILKNIPDNSINLIVTSPPYADARFKTYGGIDPSIFSDWLFNISKELIRVLKPDGSLVINIKEGVKNKVRETYILEYQLKMAKEFYWNDTFIWNKKNPFPTGAKNRLKDGFEYCFHYSKTNSYKFFPNNLLEKTKSKWFEGEKRRKNKGEILVTNGSGMNMSKRVINEFVRPSNVLTCSTSNLNIAHCATFPLELPEFFIKLMTEESDVVLDPFMGSGTTAIACINHNRKYIGIEKSEDYVNLCNKRINELSTTTNINI